MKSFAKLCGIQIKSPGVSIEFEGQPINPKVYYVLVNDVDKIFGIVGKGGVVSNGLIFFNAWSELIQPTAIVPSVKQSKDKFISLLTKSSASMEFYVDGEYVCNFTQILELDDESILPETLADGVATIKQAKLFIAPRTNFFVAPSHESYIEFENRKIRLVDIFHNIKSLTSEDSNRIANILKANKEDLNLPLDTQFTTLAKLIIERIERIGTPEQFETFLLQGGLNGLPRDGINSIDITIPQVEGKLALAMIAAAAAACAVAGVCSVAAQLAD